MLPAPYDESENGMRSGLGGAARALVALVAALALGAGAVACGDDEESGGGAEPKSLKIEASGDAKAPKIKIPATVPGGLVKIEFTNGTKGQLNGQLVRTEGEHSDKEVAAELGKAVQSKPVADWFIAAGGPGEVEAGKTAAVTQVLEPGRYYVFPTDDEPKEPIANFDVSSGGGGELPEADGTVTASEYKFEGSGLKAGKATIELRNEGGEWHHFLAGQLKPGATIDEAKKFFSEENSKGPPPVDPENPALSSTVMNGGVSQLVDVELKPGKYAFFCFIADRKGGPPHVAKGMVSEVTVEE
jgi:hypothetical protein